MTAPTKEHIRANLPHLYGYPWYEWAWKFFTSTNRMNLLCAANQISKSSTQIRKCIDWCTNNKKWPQLWPKNPVPRNIWYLYPDSKVATIELETKWIPEFLPRGPFKDHHVFGWKAIYEKKRIEKIVFNSGVQLHFKTYMQNPASLQSSTVHAIFCFPRGTQVLTRDGERCISTILVGDEVMTHRGWRRVKRVMRAEREVITRVFSNGQKVTATPDHPFWTSDGWTDFGSLTEKSIAYTVPAWKRHLIKKLFCLRGGFLRAFQRAKTIVPAIIFAMDTIVFYTSVFGKLQTAGNAPKDMWCITRTTTRSTIDQKTYNSCPDQSTPHTTNLKNGRSGIFTPLIARSAGKNLNQGRPKGRFLDIVLKIADESGKRADALFAKLISRLAWTYQGSHVVPNAETKSASRQEVINLEVDDSHTYFANGFLVHNCDEELPEHIYDELQFRLAGTDGYFHMVFTATLNQEMWWRAMEATGAQEKFPEAFKQQISMYDCQWYRDGTKGAFDKARISNIIKKCKSDNEVKRRVYGRFVADTGLKYPAFDPARHFVAPFPIEPGKWHLYGGVDPGTGGGSGHPAAMGIVAVRPDYRMGYVCRGKRLDGMDSASSDILAEFRDMRGSWMLRNQFYDQASRDFNIVASRAGESFTKSEKSHELGEDIVNTLFKNDMLFIFDTPELRKLGQELITLRIDTVKRRAADDFIDGAVRYPCVGIPWDWTALAGEETEEEKIRKATESRPFTEEEYHAWVDEQRRGTTGGRGSSGISDEEKQWAKEVEFWNDCYGS